jgi:hypothetical protein
MSAMGSRSICRGVVIVLACTTGCWTAARPGLAQTRLAAAGSVQQPDALQAEPKGAGRVRQLAPGVLTVIPPGLEDQDTVSSHPIVELLAERERLDWQPKSVGVDTTLLGMAAQTEFRHEVWGLEFSFKPLRMIPVDVPQNDGRMQRRLIWYLVYRVRNIGDHLKPVRQEDGTFRVERVADPGQPIRFVPKFELYSYEYKKCYLDEVLPVAMGPIRRREDPGRPLLNSVQMASQEIPLSTDEVDRSVWGVATWGGFTTIDPRIDFFSIFVQGLSNAYRWEDPQGAYRAGDPPGAGRRFTRRTLQLNFWRPGDELHPSEREFRFGIPAGTEQHYGLAEPVAYRWLYMRSCGQ